MPEVPNHVFEDLLREMGLKWLRDMLIDPTRLDQVYWDIARASVVT